MYSFFTDPELTPTLIGTFFSLHAYTIFLTFSSLPILPGFILIPSAPLFTDLKANL